MTTTSGESDGRTSISCLLAFISDSGPWGLMRGIEAGFQTEMVTRRKMDQIQNLSAVLVFNDQVSVHGNVCRLYPDFHVDHGRSLNLGNHAFAQQATRHKGNWEAMLLREALPRSTQPTRQGWDGHHPFALSQRCEVLRDCRCAVSPLTRASVNRLTWFLYAYA